jgi:hypothetical protein
MYKNIEELLKELEDVRADRDDALDCANKAKERIREEVEFEMPPELKKHYNKLKLDAELEELKKAESMKKECEVAARQIKIMHDSFIDAGFTDSQAFGLLTSIIPAVLNPATVQAPSVEQFIRKMLL